MKIDKGVPITSGPQTRSGKWKDLLLDMEIGDSVLVDSKTETMTIRAASFGLGMRVTCRKEADKFRVWRIEV